MTAHNSHVERFKSFRNGSSPYILISWRYNKNLHESIYELKFVVFFLHSANWLSLVVKISMEKKNAHKNVNDDEDKYGGEKLDLVCWLNKSSKLKMFYILYDTCHTYLKRWPNLTFVIVANCCLTIFNILFSIAIKWKERLLSNFSLFCWNKEIFFNVRK